MTNNFDKFSKEFIYQIKDKVVSVTEFGSDKGENRPDLSDIDLFILAKNRKEVKEIFAIARNLEKKFLGTVHSKFTDFLQRNFFISNDFCGLHLIVLGQEEISPKRFNLKSFRLRVASFFISKSILEFNIKHRHRLIYGMDLASTLRPPQPTKLDRVSAFTIPFLVLITLPFIFWRHRQFEIWCFKALRYHGEDLLVYSQILLKNFSLKLEDLEVHYLTLNILDYRYHPEKYKKSVFLLYVKTWVCLIANTPFLWQGPILKRN